MQLTGAWEKELQLVIFQMIVFTVFTTIIESENLPFLKFFPPPTIDRVTGIWLIRPGAEVDIDCTRPARNFNSLKLLRYHFVMKVLVQGKVNMNFFFRLRDTG